VATDKKLPSPGALRAQVPPQWRLDTGDVSNSPFAGMVSGAADRSQRVNCGKGRHRRIAGRDELVIMHLWIAVIRGGGE